jgi:signal transduction histidine kinase
MPLVHHQLEIWNEIKIPLHEQIKHYTKEQLVEITKRSVTEFLSYLAEDRALELLELSTERWKANQLPGVNKFELIAEDITLINFVRAKSFRNFISFYTKDMTVALELADELDSIFTGSTTTAINTYIEILKERITVHENNLLEAQRIAGMGSFEWDLVTQEKVISPEVYRIFDLEPGGDVRQFMHFVHPADRARVQEAMDKAFSQGNYQCEYRYLKNDTLKYIWSKGMVFFEDEKPAKFIGTIQDITSRKNAEFELMEKTIALEQSNESLQQFAFVASHDLQEPVRQIGTFTDIVLAREKNLTEPSLYYLKKVFTYTVRMRQMLDDIMAYSTLTQWEHKELTDLGQVVSEATQLLSETIELKNCVIKTDALPQASVIPAQARQLFKNLISNALKFSRNDIDPDILITHRWLGSDQVNHEQLAIASRYLEITVKDNGIGFDNKYAGKIFDLFSRLHTRNAYEGSGLGLAISKRIVNNHGGVIFASSRQGKGATFIFLLPQ